MPSTLTRSIAAALVTLAVGAPALAQDAREILLRTAAAIEQTPGGSATAIVSGQAPEQFQPTMPDATAQIVWRRGVGETTPAIRLTGEGAVRRSNESKPFDAAIIAGVTDLLDHQRRQRVRRNPEQTRDPRMALPDLFALEVLISEDVEINGFPMRDLIGSSEIAYEGDETVAGELCDVIAITLPKADDQRRAKHTLERWAIARSDGLPRRIDRVNEIPMFGTIITTVELTEVSTGAAPAPDAFDLPLPDGYQDIGRPGVAHGMQHSPGRLGQRRPARVSPESTENVRGETTRPAVNNRPTAPTFSIEDVDGAAYTNESQRGRITVLYYWGTWCIPCVAYSPLVSELAADLADRPVDVLGLAIREGDAERPKGVFERNGYAHTLVLGADDTVRPFNIRVYPTIVVVGPDNTVRASARPAPETTTEDVMTEVRTAIDAALKEIADDA